MDGPEVSLAFFFISTAHIECKDETFLLLSVTYTLLATLLLKDDLDRLESWAARESPEYRQTDLADLHYA